MKTEKLKVGDTVRALAFVGNPRAEIKDIFVDDGIFRAWISFLDDDGHPGEYEDYTNLSNLVSDKE